MLVTQPGWFRFVGISAAGAMNIVETAVILMDDCNAGTCVDSAQAFGMTELDVCLDYGLHTFVVASNTTAPTAFMNIGLVCLTCEDAAASGFECVHCGTVDADRNDWSDVKSMYR